jgi:hypothetical protein
MVNDRNYKQFGFIISGFGALPAAQLLNQLAQDFLAFAGFPD